MHLTLLFDAEDLVDPRSDDVDLEVAGLLAAEGAPVTFGVVGEKARLWERRGRADILATLRPFDLSLHTNSHSVHPTVAEYLEDKGWEEGIEEAVRREGAGVRDVERLLGRAPSCWGRGGSSWAPQIAPALRRLGVGAELLSLVHGADPRHSLYSFCGTPSYYPCYFGGFFAALNDDASLAAAWERAAQYLLDAAEQGVDWLGLYVCSPEMLRAKTWWDAPNFANGINKPAEEWRLPEYRGEAEWVVARANLRRLLRLAAGLPGVSLRTVGQVNALAAPPPEAVPVPRLLGGARSAANQAAISAEDPLLSPAEALYLWAVWLSEGRPDGDLPWRYVEGPTEEPPAGAPEVTLGPAAVREAALALRMAVGDEGRLPAAVSLGQGRVGVGTLYRALARACATGAEADVAGGPGAQVPAIGDTLAEEVASTVPGWLHKPDLDASRLAAYTRLQSWTVRPVQLR